MDYLEQDYIFVCICWWLLPSNISLKMNLIALSSWLAQLLEFAALRLFERFNYCITRGNELWQITI